MDKILPSGITVEQLENLRSLVHKFEVMQQSRMAFENRIRAIRDETTSIGRLGWIVEEGIVEGVNPVLIEEASKRGKNKKVLGFKSYENELLKQMVPIVESNRLHTEWLSMTKGFGILTTAKLIAYFEPYWSKLEIVVKRKKQEKGKKLVKEKVKTKVLYPPKSRSSLTHLCDYLVDSETGRAEKRRKGKSTSGNPKFKRLFYVIFESILKQKGKCYDIWKEYHEQVIENYPNYLKKWYDAETREECKKLHPSKYIPSTLDLSRRRWIKTFISLLWEKYQEIYGLEITRPQHARDQPLTDEEWIHPNDICEPFQLC